MLSLHELVQQYKRDSSKTKVTEPVEVLQARGKRIYDTHIKILELLDQSIQTVEQEIVILQNDITDRDFEITGARDNINTIFQLRCEYEPSSTKVYLDGLRMTMHPNYDYLESGPKTIQFNYPPEPNTVILVDYKKK